MIDADLNPCHNKWYAVYDFNDPSKTQKNWRIVRREEEEKLWCPLGTVENCVQRFSPDRQSLVISTSSPEKCTILSESDDVSDVSSESNYGGDTGNGEDSTSQNGAWGIHKLKSFGQRAWSMISQTVHSIRLFCVGIISGGYRDPRNMISFWGSRETRADEQGNN